MGDHVDDSFGLATGDLDPSKNEIVQYLIGQMAVVYATTCCGWKKFLGRNYVLDSSARTVSRHASDSLEAACAELLEGVVITHPKHIYSEYYSLKDIFRI